MASKFMKVSKIRSSNKNRSGLPKVRQPCMRWINVSFPCTYIVIIVGYCGCLAFAYSPHQRFIHFITVSRILNCISFYPQEQSVLQLRAVGFLLEFRKVSGTTCFPQTPGPWDVTGPTRSNRVQRVRYLQGFLQVIQTFRLGESRWNRQVKEIDHVNSQGAQKKVHVDPYGSFFKYKSKQNTQLEA